MKPARVSTANFSFKSSISIDLFYDSSFVICVKARLFSTVLIDVVMRLILLICFNSKRDRIGKEKSETKLVRYVNSYI